MKRATEKLNSRRGASMLLALVFVLACVMVGVSILSAAASNAGRTHSNHAEQQLYLSLSSALQLVSDDLARSKYTPQVSDSCSVSERQEPTGAKDENGKPVMRTITTYTHTLGKTAGVMDGGSLGGLFRDSLDMIFSTYMRGKSFPGFEIGDDEFRYSNTFSAYGEQSFTLTVAPEDLVTGDDDTYDATREVLVDVDIDDSYSITLTARLAADDADADSYSKNFRLSTKLTRSSSAMPDIDTPTYGSNEVAIIPASPAVTWKQDVIESAYVTGGGTP